MNKVSDDKMHDLFRVAYKKVKRRSKRNDILKILAGIIIFACIAIPFVVCIIFVIGLLAFQEIFILKNNNN